MASKPENPNITVRVTPVLKEHWAVCCDLIELESSVVLRAVVRAALLKEPADMSKASDYDTGDRETYLNTRLGAELWAELDKKFQAKRQKAVFIRQALIAALCRFREKIPFDKSDVKNVHVRIDWPFRF